MRACTEYNIKYRPGKEIGRGAYGRVYEISNDGDHIMKLIKLGEDYETKIDWIPGVGFDDFLNEINMQNTFASYGFSVPVIDSWICDNEYGIIVMRRFEASLFDYLKANPKINKKQLYTHLQKFIGAIHQYKISHGDFGLKNIMIDSHKYHKNSFEVKIQGKIYYLYLIDFSFAGEGSKFNLKVNTEFTDLEYLEEIKKELKL